jgi:prevent-host-death family protein
VAVDPAARQYDIHEAEANLSPIVDRVEHGEEIVISRGGTPVARVVPLRPGARRGARGSLAGRLVVEDDWDAPEVNEAIARDFGLDGR